MTKKKTHWKKLNNPNYLGTYALDPDDDMTVTIDRAVQEEVTGSDGKKEQCLVLHFKEKHVQPMILNVTNAKQIERIYGTPYIEDWQGKKIQLYIAQITAFGQQMDAIRIRPKAPEGKPELTPDHPKWSGAVDAFANGKTTIPAIKKSYILTAEYEDILIKEAL
jgi:hypothetical protein